MYSDKEYETDNCVPCCQICNYIKNTLGYYEFLHIIEHICAHNKLHELAKTDYEFVTNNISGSYSEYKHGANKRNKEFLLTKDDFNKIVENDCYICGKENQSIIKGKNLTIIHQNGVDRFNNEIGYILENCRSCCIICNYLKKNYSYELFMNKVKKIFANRNNKIIDEKDELFNANNEKDDELSNINNEVSSLQDNELIKLKNTKMCAKTKSKKSNDELREINRLNKQKSRQLMKEKYGDEEYKRKKALDMAEYRANKKAAQ